jgi:hypothetical protein
MFRLVGLLATQVAPAAVDTSPLDGRGLYVHASLDLFPPRAVDMLAVRIEQLTA